MNTSLLTIIIVLAVGIGIVFGVWIGMRIRRGKKEEGLSAHNAAKVEKKKENKKKILELFVKQSQVSNNDVEKLIWVSDAAASNYLQELENEGKIEQVGVEGRGVFYKLR